MKLLMGFCLMIAVSGLAASEENKGKYEHISQDDVCLDLSSGKITFNDVAIDRDQLRARARRAFSISFTAVDFSGSGSVDDLFVKGPAKPVATRYIPLNGLTSALEALAAAEIDPNMVLVNACYL